MKKNIVFLLILIPIIWISCDGMGHQTIDFRKVENLMPQHPDSALMLLEQIENKENLSRKDKAHYSLLLTEAEDIIMRKQTIWNEKRKLGIIKEESIKTWGTR